MKLGIDVGSTTIKCVLVDENNKILYSNYIRHFSKVKEALKFELENIIAEYGDNLTCFVGISGSAGIGLAQNLDIEFVQEVYATKIAVEMFYPKTDVVIELGGEDAKILF